MTTPRKTQKRRKKKGKAKGELYAVMVGMILGGALAALQLQEGTPRLSQVPEFLLATTSFVAMFLVTAALTERVRDGLMCGVIAVISQFLAMLSFYSYSYTITVAIAVVPYQSLRILTYPAAGLIGGYVGSYTREARSTEPSTDRTRQPTNHKTHLRSI